MNYLEQKMIELEATTGALSFIGRASHGHSLKMTIVILIQFRRVP
jgi:hypothetical protein